MFVQMGWGVARPALTAVLLVGGVVAVDLPVAARLGRNALTVVATMLGAFFFVCSLRAFGLCVFVFDEVLQEGILAAHGALVLVGAILTVRPAVALVERIDAQAVAALELLVIALLCSSVAGGGGVMESW